jgi:hypothetical protein
VSALAPRLLLVVFCPFAAGYFLSFFFRNVNAVISKDLAREFALSPAELGLLTSNLPACVRGIPAAARRAARSLRAARVLAGCIPWPARARSSSASRRISRRCRSAAR